MSGKTGTPIALDAVVPGGIWPIDHDPGYDETCSRCRRAIPEDEIPLLLWLPPDQTRMLAYCERCLAAIGIG